MMFETQQETERRLTPPQEAATEERNSAPFIIAIWRNTVDNRRVLLLSRNVEQHRRITYCFHEILNSRQFVAATYDPIDPKYRLIREYFKGEKDAVSRHFTGKYLTRITYAAIVDFHPLLRDALQFAAINTLTKQPIVMVGDELSAKQGHAPIREIVTLTRREYNIAARWEFTLFTFAPQPIAKAPASRTREETEQLLLEFVTAAFRERMNRIMPDSRDKKWVWYEC